MAKKYFSAEKSFSPTSRQSRSVLAKLQVFASHPMHVYYHYITARLDLHSTRILVIKK